MSFREIIEWQAFFEYEAELEEAAAKKGQKQR